MAPALLSLDITPKTPADQQKLAAALRVLAAEDVELRVSPGIGHACTTIGTTGGAHLDRTVDRLRREFEVEADVGKPTLAHWTGTGYQPLPPGTDGDDATASPVGVPRRPAPTPRPTAASVPEPDDDAEVP